MGEKGPRPPLSPNPRIKEKDQEAQGPAMLAQGLYTVPSDPPSLCPGAHTANVVCVSL